MTRSQTSFAQTIHALVRPYQLIGRILSSHKLKRRKLYNIPGIGGIDVGGAVELLTCLKSFVDMVRAKGSLGLIGEECASVVITVTMQPGCA